MKRSSTTTISGWEPAASKHQVLQAIQDLVMNGQANLYSISHDECCLCLATGETFTLGQRGVFRIA